MAAQAERGITVRADRTVSDPIEERRLLANLILADATEEERNLVLNICGRYNLDPLLKHVALIGGNRGKSLYITRDGLIRVAHQSGQFNGMQVVKSEQNREGKWRVTVDVYRKDMDHPFRYTAIQEEHEQPKRGSYDGPWQKSPHAMTQKCAEVMALRRAFDVSLGAAEEVGYDGSQRSNIGEVTIIEPVPHQLAERGAVREKAAPPPLPAQGLPAGEFATFIDDFLVMAEEGHSNSALIGAMVAKAPVLDQAQRDEIKAHYGAIVEGRKATRAARMVPDALSQEIIEAPVQVAPPPTTAAQLAASDDPFGDSEATATTAQATVQQAADPGSQRATERQVKFIFAIGREARLSEQDVTTWSVDLYGLPVDQLNRRDAATLIEALQRRRNEVADPFDGGAPASFAG